MLRSARSMWPRRSREANCCCNDTELSELTQTFNISALLCCEGMGAKSEEPKVWSREGGEDETRRQVGLFNSTVLETSKNVSASKWTYVHKVTSSLILQSDHAVYGGLGENLCRSLESLHLEVKCLILWYASTQSFHFVVFKFGLT